MPDPIERTIEVPLGPEKAFRTFVEDLPAWWPLDRFTVSAMGGTPATTVHLEPRVDGRIVEIGPDDREHVWGTILAFEPGEVVRMRFHVPHPQEQVGRRGVVEVRFTALADDRTRVTLTHDGWEAFGSDADMVRGGYDQAWTLIFGQAYPEACYA